MRKKAIALVLTLALLLGLTAGCAPTTTPSAPSSPTTVTGQVTTPQPTAPSQPLPTTPPPATPQATGAIDKAFSGIGGKAAIEGLNSFTYESSAKRGLLFEGLKPEDPPRDTSNFTLKASHDIATDSLRLDYTRNIDFLGVKTTTNSSEIVVGNLGVVTGAEGLRGGGSGDMTSVRMASTKRQALLLNPHLVLKTVARLPAVASETGTGQLDGKEYLLITVKNSVSPFTLYVDPATGDIARLATKENDYLRRDVDLEVTFGGWQTADGGLRFPTSVKMTLGGALIHDETRSAFQANPSLAADLFKFPDTAKPVYDADAATRGERSAQYHQMFAAVGLPRDASQPNATARQLAPGVYFIAGGSHNSLAIEQSNGIVVVEAPLDEARSKAVISTVKTTIPGKAITFMVSDHHHIDHSGGLRTYVAEGAAIVTGEGSSDFFTTNFAARSTIEPDALELNRKAAVVKAVPLNGSFAMPDTLRPVSAWHVPSTHAVDMVMAYVEKEGIVFISDIYSPPGDPGPSAKELNDVIVKNNLKVNLIVGGHGDVISYTDFLAKLPK